MRAINSFTLLENPEKTLSKYQPLNTHLASIKKETNEVLLTFDQIEEILNARLPKSASDHREWWSNQKDTSNRPQAHAWMSAGFEVDELQLNGPRKWVRYKRV